MSNNISIRNIDPQQITISGAGQPTGITNVYVNGVDVTVGTKAYVLVPTNNNELINGAGYITAAEETDPTVPSYVKAISLADINSWNDKQDQLVSTQNIKSINGESILGSGNLDISTEYRAGDGIDITDDVISNTITSYNDLSDTPTIPTRTSDLVNDSGFITNQTDSLVNYLTTEVLEDILPHTSDSGTEDLYLEDSVKYKIKIELNPSEIEQHTTTGAQLFDKNNMNNINGYYIASNGQIVSGYANKICWVQLESNTDYYLYQDMVSNVSRRPTLFNSEPNIGDTGTILSTITGTSIIDFTFNSGSTIYLAWVYCNTENLNGHTEQEMIDSIMLNQGTTHEDYEEYTGGMPSPNPLYPQDIHVTSGENTITVCGKNIYDGVEYNNYINSLGNLSTNNTNYLGISEMIKCIPSTQYTVTYQHDNPTANLYVAYKDINGNLISRTSYLTSRTFTTPNNAVLMFPYLNKSGVTFDTVGGYVQIERGSTATSYTPYQSQEYPIDLNNFLTYDGNTDICKITSPYGVYETVIFLNSKDHRYHDENNLDSAILYADDVFKYVFNPSDEWYKVTDYVFETEITSTNPYFGTTKHYALCSHLLDLSIVSDDRDNQSWIYTFADIITVHLAPSLNINTIEDFYTWITDNNVIMYAIRGGISKVYTRDGLSEENPLYYQYRNLFDNNTAYEGGTNISQENFDLPFDIEADTFKKIS